VKRRALAWSALPAAAAALLALWKTADADIFVHVATGRVILDSGRLVRTNLFSSTFPHYPWANPEWLFQVLVAAVERAGGWAGVVLLKTALVLLLAALMHFGIAAITRRPALAAGITVASLAGMHNRFAERPQLLSYALFTLVVLIVERSRREGPRRLWPLVPLFALWGNIQPELILGLLYLAAEAAGGFLNRAVGDPEGGRGAEAVALAAAAAVPASLLNPEGWRVLAYPFEHLAVGPVVRVLENGFNRPADAPLFWAWLALCVLLLAARGRRQDWRDVLAAAGFGLLGTIWLRNGPYLFLATAPAAARMLAARAGGAPPPPRAHAFAGAAAAAAAFVFALGFEQARGRLWGLGLDERVYPVRAADLLAGERWEGRLYNHFSEGSYLAYRLYPRAGVFQDGRVPAYPRAFLARLNAGFRAADWPAIAREFDVRLALVHPWEVHGYFDPASWGILLLDDRYCLLARRGAGNDGLLARRELAVPGFTAP
jgi:hypothetical protein